MTQADKPSSLQAFIEQTAKMLRTAASETSLAERTVSKGAQGSVKGKIEQIAQILRSTVKKRKRPRKKGRS